MENKYINPMKLGGMGFLRMGDSMALPYYPVSMGYWVRREEWEETKKLVDAWFNTNPDQRIDDNNSMVDVHLTEHINSKFRHDDCPLCVEFMQNNIQKPRFMGSVYLIQSEYGCKIGKSKDPKRRKDEIKLPFKSTMIHSFKCSDYSAKEKELHRLFADKRIDGEWFNLDEQDINYIKSLTDEVR